MQDTWCWVVVVLSIQPTIKKEKRTLHFAWFGWVWLGPPRGHVWEIWCEMGHILGEIWWRRVRLSQRGCPHLPPPVPLAVPNCKVCLEAFRSSQAIIPMAMTQQRTKTQSTRRHQTKAEDKRPAAGAESLAGSKLQLVTSYTTASFSLFGAFQGCPGKAFFPA